MLDKWGRKLKDTLLNPLGRGAGKILSPNGWTTLSLMAGLGAAALVLADQIFWALGAWGLCRIFDGVDGTVARVTGRQTDFGGYYDLMADFLVYAALPLALAYRADSSELWMACAILLAVFYVNGASWMVLSALLEKKKQANPGQTSLIMPGGVIGGTETILFYTAFLLFPDHLRLLFLLMAALTFFGIPWRFIWACKHLESARNLV